MKSGTASNYPTALIIFRIVSFLTISFILFYFAISDNKLKFFFYLTHWGLMLTFTYFLLALMNYLIDFINTAVCIMFLTIWGFNWVITILFWSYIAPSHGLKHPTRDIVTHSIPLILTLIDYALNKIQFERRWFIIVLLLMLSYFFGLLLPYTLVYYPVYRGIDFVSYVSFIIVVTVPAVLFALMEAGRCGRRLIDSRHESREREEPLLDKRIEDSAYEEREEQLLDKRAEDNGDRERERNHDGVEEMNNERRLSGELNT